MIRGLRVDQSCSNVSSHPKRGKRGTQHAISEYEFADLVREQLAKDLDYNFEPLGLDGARGTLYRITLQPHGYIFVGKGTVGSFIPDLRHEGKTYQQLDQLQGTAVPVYLGNIDLVEMYYHDLGVPIIHLLLMSWGGEAIEEAELWKANGLLDEVDRTVAEVRDEGIDQHDVRSPNVLWNEEVGRVMLVDFERAIRIKSAHNSGARPLHESSPNKRQKLERLAGKVRKVD
jgi:hypothetical protein